MEIESRLLPCGLHVVGCMPTADEAIATLVNIGELERPDQKPEPIRGLPGIMARAIGRDIEDIYKGSNKVRYHQAQMCPPRCDGRCMQREG